ncbi:MAG: helix-turn-helix transcriptional regulator [Clostridia bacterium]|nr:helix-turn-helix transcriptional regulator [Clostridia bacterium]
MKLKIKEYREELQLTQKELAEKINNSQRNISNWESGASEPDCETIIKLAEIFDISIDQLFGREPQYSVREPAMGIDYNILKEVRNLTDTQKFALMQFLREIHY